MDKKNLMVQTTHSTEYSTENLFPELVELSENDLKQIVGAGPGPKVVVTISITLSK